MSNVCELHELTLALEWMARTAFVRSSCSAAWQASVLIPATYRMGVRQITRVMSA